MSPPPANPNLAQLTLAAERLAPLLPDIAFVGGCVTALLITDPAAASVRTTLDVDAIMQIASYAEFTELNIAFSILASIAGRRHRFADGLPTT